jgi:hypothetical protein
MSVHPGAFCSPAGGTGDSKAGTPMICSITTPGSRARWRRNGPSPARASRGNGGGRSRKNATTGAALPQVDAGIDPHKVPEPAAAPTDTPLAKPATVDGRHTDKAPLPNEWGGVPRNGAHCVHFDGPLPRAVDALGPDARIDMGGGEPLADTVLNLADQVRARQLHPAELPDRLRDVQARLPEGSSAHRKLGAMIADVDAPTTPAPQLPAGTPEPIRELVHTLNEIPICRQRPDRELNKLVAIAQEATTGRLRGRMLGMRIADLNRHEMYSDTGSIQINRALQAAREAVERRPSRG